MQLDLRAAGDVRQNNNFGSLRLLLAALVVVGHSPELIDGDRSRELLTSVFGTLSLGEIAVDGFFLISGYLIMKSFRHSSSVATYTLKRVLRIYPGFIVAFLISTFIVGFLADGDLSQISPLKTILKIVGLGLPGVPEAFHGMHYAILNGSLWTIPYEFRCYIAVILFGWLASRSHRALYAVLLLILAGLYETQSFLSNPKYLDAIIGNWNTSVRLTFIFFVGGAFYVWRDRIALTHRGAGLAFIALVICMFVSQLAEPAFALLGGYLIFWFAFVCETNFVSRMMDHTDPSYGLYLYAWPIQSLLIFKVPGISPWIVTVVTLPLATAAGLASWYLIEKPAIHAKLLLPSIGKTQS